MYPQVFAAFDKHRQDYSDVSVLPTPAIFYGLRLREEISVDIEPGKTLIIRLVNVSEPDKDGRRTVTYELNGMTREALIADKSLAEKVKVRPKANLTDPRQIPAPIPGLIATIAVSVGSQSPQGRQAPDDGGHENANHRVRPAGWRGRGVTGQHRGYGGKQGPAAQAADLRRET